MPDDEPLDDVRGVATAAAAAAARVAETVAREASDHRARQQATLDRAQDQRRAQQALAQVGSRYEGTTRNQPVTAPRGPSELEQAQKWASPERLQAHYYDREGCDSTQGKQSVDAGLVREWKAATAPYDSPDRRAAADRVREAAGVPAEARQVRATADLMNGTDPRTAAQGRPAKTTAKPPAPVVTREAARGR